MEDLDSKSTSVFGASDSHSYFTKLCLIHQARNKPGSGLPLLPLKSDHCIERNAGFRMLEGQLVRGKMTLHPIDKGLTLGKEF